MKANDIRVGNIIKHENILYRVLKFQHVKPGKGGAFIQAELKSIDGMKKNIRFRSSESVEKPFIENKEYTYLFHNNNIVTLLDINSYEEIEIDSNLFNPIHIQFLSENMKIMALYCENTCIECSIPKRVIMKIKSCDAHIKNQTVTASNKKAILSNGYEIEVPLHVKEGYEIVIDTENMSYVEINDR